MSEERQELTIDDLSEDMLNITSDAWTSAGLTAAGKVGFKITTAELNAAKDKNGIYPRAELEIQINARPDREVTGKGERFWPKMRLDGSWLRNFKNLTAAAGIKTVPGQPLALKEVVAALAGRAAFGSIIHDEWTGRDGAKQVTAKLGNRFGKSFKELG